MGFQESKLTVGHVMWEPCSGEAGKRNGWRTSPFWSSGQIYHSHGNWYGPDDPSAMKAFTERSQAEEQPYDKRRGGCENEGHSFSFSWSQMACMAASRPGSAVLCEGDNDKWLMSITLRSTPSPQTAPVATKSDASVSCHLSLSLPVEKKVNVRFLPPGHRAQARFQKKDVLVLITHPYDYSQ